MGVVDDEEIILRASYDPMHWKKSKIQSSFVRASHLLEGELSVWRSSEKSGLTVSDVMLITDGVAPPGNTTKQLHGPLAREIRGLRNPSGDRLFCVVDETTTDEAGGHHPAHAHIRLCDVQRASIAGVSDPNFEWARQRLILLMKQPATTFPRP